MTLYDIIKTWKDYPKIMIDKAFQNPSKFKQYKLIDLGSKVGESAIISYISYEVGDDPIFLFLGYGAYLARFLQTSIYANKKIKKD